ncbi:MAG: hypothetical protein AAFX45_02890 [Pseudomonadota bacterium]
MRYFLAVAAVVLAPVFANAQEAPTPSLVRVGPMPQSQETLGELIAAMQTYSRDTCGIALLLRADPAAFPNETYGSADALAEQMGLYFARNFSVSTRIYLVERDPGPVTVMAHINGHLFARAREFQNFNLRDFTEMGGHLAVANHSIKAIQKALYEDLSGQNRRIVDLLGERIQVEENIRDLAETQLRLLKTTPDRVALSDAQRANPGTEVERHMATYLDATEAVARFRAERETEEAALARSDAGAARNDCEFAAPDRLYGASYLGVLRTRVARDHGRAKADVFEAEIMRWIVETGFGTPISDK